MSKKKDNETAETTPTEATSKKCFVIMPIAEKDGYETGHFVRVFNNLIKPACLKANFVAELANSTSESHSIVLHILQSLVTADMVVCDLSTANANVLYELGIRQMLGKPVALIRDERIQKIFDIESLRYTDYHSSLRVDLVEQKINEITKAIEETYANRDKNTKEFTDQLGTKYVTIETDDITVSEGENAILSQLKELTYKVSYIEKNEQFKRSTQTSTSSLPLINPSTGKVFGIPLTYGKRYLTNPGQLICIARQFQPENLYFLASAVSDDYISIYDVQNGVFTPFNFKDSEAYITRFFPENLDYKTALILFQPQQLLTIQELRRRHGLAPWEIL